ncbi:MAG TPA: hypothetical protein ENK23_06020, partial [Sorangium sp.]|nr:hypothetical protein [Sorangium sp.]
MNDEHTSDKNGTPDAGAGSERPRLDLVAGAPGNQRAAIAAGNAALRAALRPDALAAADNEALLALALGVDVAEHDAAEKAEAEALRRALAGEQAHPLRPFAEQLRAAWDSDTCAVDTPSLEAADNEIFIALATALPAGAAVAGETGPATEATRAWQQQLRCAWGNGPCLADADGEALLALAALGEADVSDETRRQAVALRGALAGDGEHSLGRWATALRSAHAPAPLDELSQRRLLKRALNAGPAPRQLAVGGGQRRRVPGRNLLVASMLAMAAAALLFAGSVRWLDSRSGPTARRNTSGQAGLATMTVSRSTADLFDPMTPFPVRG